MSKYTNYLLFHINVSVFSALASMKKQLIIQGCLIAILFILLVGFAGGFYLNF